MNTRLAIAAVVIGGLVFACLCMRITEWPDVPLFIASLLVGAMLSFVGGCIGKIHVLTDWTSRARWSNHHSQAYGFHRRQWCNWFDRGCVCECPIIGRLGKHRL